MEEQKVDVKQKSKFSVNVWQILSIVLVVALVASVLTNGFRFGKSDVITGASIVDSDTAAKSAITYINENVISSGEVKFVSVSEQAGLYEVLTEYNGQSVPIYVTKDNHYVFLSALDINEVIVKPETTSVKQSDKPKVELFVMSHCPYGTQAEKGILPVIKLLKEKIDFELKFVYYAMHGEVELKEEMTEYCIKTEQGDKLLDYLTCFLKDGKSDACIVETKVDKVKLDTCVAKLDTKFNVMKQFNDKTTWLSGRYPLFDVNKEDNTKYNVGGSPTLVVNGVTLVSDSKYCPSGKPCAVISTAARDPASFLATVCSAFKNQPAECKEKLSTAVLPAGFGYDVAATGAADSGGSCG